MQVNGAAQLRLLWALGGAEGAVNVIGCVVTGTVTFNQALANALGSAIKGSFNTTLATHISTGVTLARVGIRDLRTDSQAEFFDTGTTAPGTSPGELLPRAVSSMVTVRTAQSGKSFRGRVYLPGFTETDNDLGGDTVLAASTASIAFVQAIDSALKANGMAMGVLSRPAEHTTIVKTVFHADGTQTVRTLSNQTQKDGQITQMTALEVRDSRWQYQRRRDNTRTVAPAALAGPIARVTV